MLNFNSGGLSAPGVQGGYPGYGPGSLGGFATMDPMSSMLGMMTMMMGLLTQGMLGSMLGMGGQSPLGLVGANPRFGAGGNSMANIGRGFLGAGPSGRNRSPGARSAGAARRAGAASGGSSRVSGPGVQSMLKKAGSMVGLHESRNRDQIKKLTGKSGIDPATTPWCAAFAMNLIKDHGLDDLKGLSNRNYCPTIESWARGKGKYGQPGKYKPKPGDAILFTWNGSKGTPNHIGIVEKVQNGKVYTIEGNSSDSVKRKVYPLNSSVIDGYVITGKKR